MEEMMDGTGISAENTDDYQKRHIRMKQAVLPFLPGYMFDGYQLRSTGMAIAPTQHVNKKNGEIMYYCVPVWPYGGQKIGLFVRHKGIVDWVNRKAD